MFEKTMGNVFQNHGQRFGKLRAMFFRTMGNVFARQAEPLLLALPLIDQIDTPSG